MSEYKLVFRHNGLTTTQKQRASSLGSAIHLCRRTIPYMATLDRAYRRLGNRWMELA